MLKAEKSHKTLISMKDIRIRPHKVRLKILLLHAKYSGNAFNPRTWEAEVGRSRYTGNQTGQNCKFQDSQDDRETLPYKNNQIKRFCH